MKRQHRRRRVQLYADLARQRIIYLYRLALRAAREGQLDYARELGSLAWEIYRSTRARIPRSVKRGLCRRCHVPLIPGVTARVRLRSQGGLSYVVVTCLNCGWTRRYPYKRRRTGLAAVGCAKSERKPEEEGEASTSRPSRRDNREARDNRGGST